MDSGATPSAFAIFSMVLTEGVRVFPLSSFQSVMVETSHRRARASRVSSFSSRFIFKKVAKFKARALLRPKALGRMG